MKGGDFIGTRGCYGFRLHNTDKLTISFFDSYPSHLGVHICEFISSNDIDSLKRIASNIKLVSDTEVLSTEDYLLYTSQLDIPHQKTITPTWGDVLDFFAGDLSIYKKDFYYMSNYNHFIKDSLFCEWAYIINLDTLELEVYRGFQNEPQKNRYYVNTPQKNYYNCSLLCTFSLQNLTVEHFKTHLENSI